MIGRNPQLRFGALSPSLVEQLTAQGATITNAEAIAKAQEHADAVSKLYVAGVLTETEATQARRRIIRRFVAPHIGGA